MPYFDTVIPEYDSAEILNLCRIVELCNPPDVGPSPLDPDLTPEARHTNALTTLEKTSGVFDDAFYQDAVLSDQVPESLLDESLLEKARAKEVPEDHLPNKCMRTPPPCPAPPITIQPPSPYLAQIAKFPTAPNSPVPSDSKPKLRSLDLQRLNNAPESQPRPSLSRPSLSLPSLRSFLTLSPSSNSVRLPTPTNSVTSFFSGSSRMSLRNYAKRGKRRDTLRNLFRRDYTFSQRPSPLDETMAWNPSSASESASESAAPSLDSSTVTHDQSSVQSSSLSSRTSTSSFIDIPTLSWLDNRTLQQSVKTPRFTSLQIRCQNEGKRFIDFAQHQRVALPLFLGRTRVYLEGRMATRVAEMKKRHFAAIEALENKHVEQELGEIDEQKVETKEETIKNATALKHMHRRLSILGENATDDARNRLEDEKYKLNRLEQRQERELQKLLRIQNREKLILQRNQQNELADLTTSMREDHDLKVRHKHEELVKNATKLEALIHERALRLVARWHLQLQILKREEKELSWIKGPLPLSILRLPEEFGPYVSAYH